jgi:SAM-dependent methyltransferase
VDDSKITPEGVRAINREAWDRQVESGTNRWTLPVSAEQIAAARRGDWTVVLTGLQPVPRDWFPPLLEGCDLLGLASGGGQQGPILAAAGASVTIFDNSPAQLSRDRAVSDEHELGIRTIEGDMADLSALADESFDLVFHPVSNLFAADVRPVWREAHRVLRPGGALLAGFMNPALYLADWWEFEKTGQREICFALPYADIRDRSPEFLAERQREGDPLEFGHSLADQIGGQLEAGFALVAMYEHERSAEEGEGGPLTGHLPEYIATRAEKPGAPRRV